MMNSNTLCFYLCFLLFFISTTSLSKTNNCHPHDKKVLLQIKKALNNPYLLASWDPKIDEDCCNWYCLKCDDTTHRVTELFFLTDDKLTGQIPPQIADLPYLESLTLKHVPNINGTIPPSITKLNLKWLWLSWTNLSGPVPEFLSQMKNLTYLNLSFNNFSGSIPSSLSQLPNLRTLRLDRNKLTGSIPESLGTLPGKGLYMYLSHNKLTGTIPASFANVDYDHLDLSRNMLEGDASVLFGPNRTSAWLVDISRNMFEFDVSKVEFPKGLAWLDMNHNKIMGSLPVGLTGLELQFLNVSYNRMCGQIPVGGRLQSFDYSTYFHNRCLCGDPLESCK